MRSHNSLFPRNFYFNGVLYDSASRLHHAAGKSAPVVKLAAFCGRVRRQSLAHNLSESTVTDALFLSAAEYTARYAVRKTWITVGDQRVSLGDYFGQNHQQGAVDYTNFRTRVLSLRARAMLDLSAMNDALHMHYGEWVSFYGGGRRKGFWYHGDDYASQSGKHFSSIAAFLRQIDRYGERQLVWSRLKSGWCLDHALNLPVAISSRCPGIVYLLTRKSTQEVYVGLTVCGLELRWQFHVRATRNGSTTKLARAIREDGEDWFVRCVLQGGIEDVQTLKACEIFFVEHYQALGPMGLNTLKPGALGRPGGIPTTFESVKYRSQNEAARCRSAADNVPLHVARAYIVKNRTIPEQPRSHSKHPEAGSNLWRRWQALLLRHPDRVVKSWVDSYDTFKTDVGFSDPKRHLVRINAGEPWGPENFAWLTQQQKIEADHGKSIVCNGLEYPSLKAVALAHGLGESTLKDRIRRQNLTVEDAVQRPLGAASKSRLVRHEEPA